MNRQGAAGAPRQLVLTSLNIQRGGSPAKLAAALDAAAAMGADVIFLQETGTSRDPRALLRGAPGSAGYSAWNGAAYFSPGSPHARGCLTLVRTSSSLISQLPEAGGARTDANGRIVRVDCQLGGCPASLINVYAPAGASAAERRAFFEELQSFVPTDRLAIVGGDFNCVLDLQLDTTSAGPASQRARGSDSLQALMTAAGLADVWREQHPHQRQPTHWNQGAGSGARLDRWLFPAAQLATWSATSSIKERGHGGITTDHCAVELRLAPPNQPPKPSGSRRSMPLDVCDSREFKSAVQALLSAALRSLGLPAPGDDSPSQGDQQPAANSQLQQPAEGGPQRSAIEVWAALKPRLLALALFYSRLRRKEMRLREAQLTAAAARARAAFTGAPADAARREAWQTATAALLAHWGERLQRARNSRSVLHQLYGDSSTYYFHSFFSSPHTPTTITELRPGPQRSANTPAVSLLTREGMAQAFLIAEAHFSDPNTGVFRERPHDEETAAQLHANLPRRLSPSWASAAEGPDGSGLISQPELRRAIRAAQRGRAPGPDGLPYEFYATFWAWLEPLLAAVFNEAFSAEDGSTTALSCLLAATITLIHKGKDKPHDHLSGFRPITLLNCDIKLLCKVLADRAQLPLDQVVELTQAAFICDRDISDSVQFHMGLAEWMQRSGHPLYLLLTDLAGAYDNVSWPFLFSTLRALGFQERGIVRWTQLVHCGSRACVLINGHASPYFQLRGGLAQGSGFSPLAWTAIAQVLSAKLNSLSAQGRLQPPRLPDGTACPPDQAYADDETAFPTRPDEEVPVILAALAEFQRAGGPGVELSKTVLYCVVDQPSPDCPTVLVVRAQPAAAAQGTTAQGAATERRQAAQPAPAAQPDPQPEPAPGGAPAARTVAQQASGAAAQDKLVHAPSQLRVVIPGRGDIPRHLGIPLSADAEAAAATAFSNAHGKLAAAGAQWPAALLSHEGRVLLAKQRLASKLLYPLAHLPMPATARDAAQRTLRNFVRGGTQPADAAQAGTGPGLQPAELICALPPRLGGLGHAILEHCETSLHAKWPARAFSHGWHPWKQLMLASFAEADTASGLPTWPITLASAPPAVRAPLLGRLTPRLRAYAQALASTCPHRLASAQPSFFSVLAEPLFLNPQLASTPAEGPSTGDGRLLLQPTHLPAEVRPARGEGGSWTGWRYVRDAWAAARGPQPHTAAVASALATVEAAMPAAWGALFAAHSPPPADWVCAEGPNRTLYVLPGSAAPPSGVGPPADMRALLQANTAGRLRSPIPDSISPGQPLPPDIQAALDAAAAALAGKRWEPAHVLSAPKHRGFWTHADWTRSEATALADSQGQVNLDGLHPQHGEPEGDEQETPAQLWLLGTWAAVPLDPTAWGHGSQPLHKYTARLGRARVTVLAAWAERPQLALPGGHAPKLWPAPTDGQQPPGQEKGLQAMEARWAASAAAREAGGAPRGPQRHSGAAFEAALSAAIQREAPWARTSFVPAGRPSPAERAAARQQRAQQQQPTQRLQQQPTQRQQQQPTQRQQHQPQAQDIPPWDDRTDRLAPLAAEQSRQAALPGQPEPPLRPWLRLLQNKNVEREHRTTAWRILHGSLMCNAYRLHLRPDRPHSEGLCPHPQCQQAGALETLTHAFLDCPAVAPALDWLLQLWAAITPGQPQPPRCALLLLADWQQAWKPSPQQAELWGLLRVTFLGCAWHQRCQRPGGPQITAQQSAFTVAASVVAFVREAIRRDWARTQHDVRMLCPHLPSRHFRGRNPELAMDAFKARWCRGPPHVCTVQDSGRLRLLLTTHHPVPVPGLPAEAAAEGGEEWLEDAIDDGPAAAPAAPPADAAPLPAAAGASPQQGTQPLATTLRDSPGPPAGEAAGDATGPSPQHANPEVAPPAVLAAAAPHAAAAGHPQQGAPPGPAYQLASPGHPAAGTAQGAATGDSQRQRTANTAAAAAALSERLEHAAGRARAAAEAGPSSSGRAAAPATAPARNHSQQQRANAAAAAALLEQLELAANRTQAEAAAEHPRN